MALFLSVILAFVVIFITASAVICLNKSEQQKDGLSEGQSMDQVAPDDWPKIVMLGVLVGLVNYFAPSSSAMIFVAPLCYLTMLGLSVYLMVWWHQQGSEWTEMVPFIILAVLFYFPAKAAAHATAAMIPSQLVAQVLVILPLCLLVVTIGFFIADRFYFMSEIEEALSKRGEVQC